MARSKLAIGREGLQARLVAANILETVVENQQGVILQIVGLAQGQQLIVKIKVLTKCHKGLRTWKNDLDKLFRLKKMDRVSYVECKKSTKGRSNCVSGKINIKI